MMKLRVSAPGKVILSGEHAVVHGYPALVTTVNRRLQLKFLKSTSGLIVDPKSSLNFVRRALDILERELGVKLGRNFEIKIVSSIPIGSGMGSSAAFAVALSASMLKYIKEPYSKEKVNELAYEVEKLYHDLPSGIDNTISTYGGILWYRKETENVKLLHRFRPKAKLGNLYILNTGKPKETTRDMVELVKESHRKRPRFINNIFSEIEKVTRDLLRHLSSEKSCDLKDLVQENERLLEQLGVVSDYTKRIVRQIEKLDGAAKVSGAGGVKDKSGILFVYHEDKKTLQSHFNKKRLNLEDIKLGGRGVYVE